MRLIRVWVVRPAVVLGLLGASGWGLCIELFMSCCRGVTRQAMCIEKHVACMCACRVRRVRRMCRVRLSQESRTPRAGLACQAERPCLQSVRVTRSLCGVRALPGVASVMIFEIFCEARLLYMMDHA